MKRSAWWQGVVKPDGSILTAQRVPCRFENGLSNVSPSHIQAAGSQRKQAVVSRSDLLATHCDVALGRKGRRKIASMPAWSNLPSKFDLPMADMLFMKAGSRCQSAHNEGLPRDCRSCA